MPRLATVLAAAVLQAALAPAPTAAQVVWDSPQLGAPHAPGGVALHAIARPGAPLGMVVAWSPATAPPGLSLRVGGSDSEAFAGFEAASPLASAGPLAAAWVMGVGASVSGDRVRTSLPVGIVARARLGGDRLRLAPYLAARTVLRGEWGAPPDTVGASFDAGADVGLELARGAAAAWLGASLGARPGVVVVGVGWSGEER